MYSWSNKNFEMAQASFDTENCDTIGGIVTNVYDANTFSVMVTEEDYDNEFEYEEYELIKIFGAPSPKLNTKEGQEKAEELFAEIDGEELILEVYGRDKHGYLIATFEVI